MHDNLEKLYSSEEISAMVGRLADEIRRDYADKNPMLVGVLKGAFIFIGDLSRAIATPHEIDFIQTASYGKKTRSSGEVLITRDITADIKGRDVIIVEGIVDSGKTMRALVDYFEAKSPASVTLCTLLLREGGETHLQSGARYVGADIGPGFVAGYGMDYKEKYRNLPGLYMIKESK